jgi:hypothetical protein
VYLSIDAAFLHATVRRLYSTVIALLEIRLPDITEYTGADAGSILQSPLCYVGHFDDSQARYVIYRLAVRRASQREKNAAAALALLGILYFRVSSMVQVK